MRIAGEFQGWHRTLLCFLGSMASLTGFAVWQSSLQAQISKGQPEVGGPAVPPTKGYVVQEIRNGLYWVSEGAYNPCFWRRLTE